MRFLRDPKKRFVVFSLVPILGLFAVIFLYPIVSAFLISMRDWTLLGTTNRFVLERNYVKVLHDPVFVRSFVNTLEFTGLYLALTVLVGLGLAVFANSLRHRLGQGLFKTIVFLPVIMITVAAGLIWRWMYVPSFGIINYVLGLIGIGPFRFLTSPTEVIPSIVVMALWKWVGMNVIIFLAGLQAIPEEYYEASRIDGAGGVRVFRMITLPLLGPTVEYVSITTILSSMQVFSEVFILTSGGPGTASRVLAFHIYEVGFKFLRLGEASAVAFLLFAFILVLTLFQFRAFRREELY